MQVFCVASREKQTRRLKGRNVERPVRSHQTADGAFVFLASPWESLLFALHGMGLLNGTCVSDVTDGCCKESFVASVRFAAFVSCANRHRATNHRVNNLATCAVLPPWKL